MNSFPKLIASIAALIASLSFAWIALTITGTIPKRHVVVEHDGSIGLLLSNGDDKFVVEHDGSVLLTHDGTVEITH